MGGGGVVVDVVEGVDFAEGAKGVFEVVDYGARHVGLGAVGGETGAEVDVMVDGGFGLVWGVGKVGFLGLGFVRLFVSRVRRTRVRYRGVNK